MPGENHRLHRVKLEDRNHISEFLKIRCPSWGSNQRRPETVGLLAQRSNRWTTVQAQYDFFHSFDSVKQFSESHLKQFSQTEKTVRHSKTEHSLLQETFHYYRAMIIAPKLCCSTKN